MNDDGSLGASEEFAILKIRDGAAEEMPAPVATEVAFTIEANGNEIATLMCTPMNLEDFCYGFLFTSGLIQGAEDVVSIRCDTTRWAGRVEVQDMPELSLLGKRVYTPGCGKGVVYASVVEMAARLPIASSIRLEPSAILEMMHRLQECSTLHKATGGVHSAALCPQSGEPEVVIDDIGRHNAVDKVIGDGLRRGVDFSERALVCSGRVSSEILHKAKRSNIPVVVSRSAPTHQSVLRARDMGMTLIGFTRGTGFNVYSHPERVEMG